ncbi:hypothetical protein CR513_17008, partial [Mucuna pruriens]
MQNRENINSRSWNNLGQNVNAGADAQPDFMQDKENINFRSKVDAETGLNSRPMDFVRGIIDEDNFMMSVASQYHYEQDADFVQIKMRKRQAILSCREGFSADSRGYRNPIVYIEVTTKETTWMETQF